MSELSQENLKKYWKVVLGYALAAVAIATFFWGDHVIETVNAVSIASQKWPTVNGRIIESRAEASFSIGDDNDETTYYIAVITYEYFVNDSRYTNNQISWQGEEYRTSMEEAQVLADLYPKGGTVVVHYDPDEPTFSVLDVELPKQPTKAGFTYFVASGVILAFAITMIQAPYGILFRIPGALIMLFGISIGGGFGIVAALSYHPISSLLMGFGLTFFAIGIFEPQPSSIKKKKSRHKSTKKHQKN